MHSQLNNPKIEHMGNLEKLFIYCRFVGIDIHDITNDLSIKIPGFQCNLNQYQFFAVVLFHIWERNKQNGGFLANGIKSEKLKPILDLI